MRTLESQWADLNVATFGFSILFALVAVLQLIITVSYGFSARQSKPEAELESEELSKHRRTLTTLMVLSLLFIIISFSFKAASYSAGFNDVIIFWADISIFTKEIATELLLAGLFAFLSYRDSAAERWRKIASGSLLNGGELGVYAMDKSNHTSMVFPVVVLLFMLAATVCRIVFVALNAIIPPLAFFVAFQVYILGLIILTVNFVVSAISAWKRRDISSIEPLNVSNGDAIFDPNYILRPMVYYVSPALCILTAFEIIRDVLSALGNIWEFIFVSTVLEGILLLFVVTVTVKAGILPRNTSYFSDFSFSFIAAAPL